MGDHTQVLAKTMLVPPWPCPMSEDFQSTWKQEVAIEISSIGFSLGLPLSMGYDQATALIKQHVADTERQLDIARTHSLFAIESQKVLCLPYGT